MYNVKYVKRKFFFRLKGLFVHWPRKNKIKILPKKPRYSVYLFKANAISKRKFKLPFTLSTQTKHVMMASSVKELSLKWKIKCNKTILSAEINLGILRITVTVNWHPAAKLGQHVTLGKGDAIPWDSQLITNPKYLEWQLIIIIIIIIISFI